MSDSTPSRTSAAGEREQQLESVIAEYIRACEAGLHPSRREILEQYPDLAGQLQQFFAQRDRLNQFAGPIREFEDDLFHAIGPGQQLSYVGNYELLEEVARGGMGVVYKARQTTLNRIVAVKMIVSGRLANEQDVQRFESEAQAAASLNHPNIVSIHEVGQHEGWHYFSMDYVDGRDLSTILRLNLLPAKKAATYVRQMAEAIHYAHQKGILHRDLKPSNILIDHQDQVRITDFGLAMRVEEDRGLTQTGQVLGTPSYMPPEQAQSKRGLIGPASDVYALGAVLYECLTGRPPFRAESIIKTLDQVIHVEAASLRTLNAAVPRDLETICLKCLEKEPHRRYETAQSLADDLGRFLRHEPILARPISHPARIVRWCRRNTAVASLLLTVALSLVGGTILASYFAVTEARLSQRADEKTKEAIREKQSAVDARSAENKARSDLQMSFNTLKSEQERSERLQLSVEDLERRSGQLDVAIANRETKLLTGEEKLYETYMQLARSAMRTDHVELANHYLNECPTRFRDGIWQALKRRCYPDVRILDAQNCVKFSADGRLIAGVSKNTIKIWDATSHNLLHMLSEGDETISAIALNRDGSQLASTQDKQVILWDVGREMVLRKLDGHEHRVSDVSFSPDGLRLATASSDGISGNQRFAASNKRGEVLLWDLNNPTNPLSISGLMRAVFSFDGRWLATINSIKGSSGVAVWDVNDTSKPTFVVPTDRIYRPEFHPLKNELTLPMPSPPGFAELQGIEVWDVATRTKSKSPVAVLDVGSFAFSSDGTRLACAGNSTSYSGRPGMCELTIWNLNTGEVERRIPWYSNKISALAYSPDGRYLASADEKSIKVWDLLSPTDPTDTILKSIAAMNVEKFDWPQWGGSTSRMNTPIGKGIPTTWDCEKGVRITPDHSERPGFDPTQATQPSGSGNIKWAVALGSETYGNPVVANHRIFLGTNNGAGYLKRYPPEIDLGVLLCLDEQTGHFLWQHSNEKLPTGRVNDWPDQGVCSTPVVDGNRLWYVSNRGEVVCLDTEGFYDDEDDGSLDDQSTNIIVRIDALLHGQIQYFRLPQSLLDEFIRIGVVLPPRIAITRKGAQLAWSLAEVTRSNDRKSNSTIGPPLFLIRVEGDYLKVYRLEGDSKESAMTEVVSLDNQMLPGFGTEKGVFAIKDKLLKHGIELLEDRPITTVESNLEWSFYGEMNGQAQLFNAKRSGSMLFIYKRIHISDKNEADVVWRFDMMSELGVFQHNMANCSMAMADGKLFVCTSNGVDESHVNLPAPEAPSFLALDRETGKVLWTDNSPGENVLHAQWASPSYGVFNGVPQVIFPGGDGWLYSFDPQGDGNGKSKLLWKFDGNAKTSIYKLHRSTRNHFIAFPAIYDGLVYIAMGEDPEHGEGPGCLWCIDPTKRLDGSDVSAELAVDQNGLSLPHRKLQAVDPLKGERAIPNPQSAAVWSYTGSDQNENGAPDFEEVFHRSLSTPVIKDDVLYTADFAGVFHCLNAKTGKFYWSYNLLAGCWSSPVLVEDKVYIADEDGDVAIFRHSTEPRMAMQPIQLPNKQTEFVPFNGRWNGELLSSQCNMGSPVVSTPIVANNVLYIATRDTLFAIQESFEAVRKPPREP